jgi:hypothetical protein
MLCSIDQRYSMTLVSMVEQLVWNGNGFRPHQVCKPAFVRAGTEPDLGRAARRCASDSLVKIAISEQITL